MKNDNIEFINSLMGVCSNMGNAFYCNAQDYATWKNTPNCTVQYVSKK